MYISGWWSSHPPGKYEFVRLDHHPNYWKNKKTLTGNGLNQYKPTNHQTPNPK